MQVVMPTNPVSTNSISFLGSLSGAISLAD